MGRGKLGMASLPEYFRVDSTNARPVRRRRVASRMNAVAQIAFETRDVRFRHRAVVVDQPLPPSKTRPALI
jgi:hypothetical protein